MANIVKQFPAIPEPTLDPRSMLETLKAIKTTLDALTGNTSKSGNGLADALRDIKSATDRASARFTEYVEVSTTDNKALARRTTTLETNYKGLSDDLGDFNSRVTDVETSYSDDKMSYAQKFEKLEAHFEGFDGKVVGAEIEKSTKAAVDGDKALAQDISKLQGYFTNLDGDTVQASIDKVYTAYASADKAIAEDVEKLRVVANGGTAEGKIVFRAQASPDSWSARYSLSVRAGSDNATYADAGFDVLARVNADGSISESAIRFNAANFLLADPTSNSVDPVFNYMDGVFYFNVPVKIKGQQLEQNAVTNSNYKREVDFIGSVDIGLYCRAGSVVDIFAEFDGAPNTAYPQGGARMVLNQIKANPDGTTTGTQLSNKLVCFSIFRNNSVNTFYYMYTGFSLQVQITETAQYSFQLLIDGPPLGPIAIKATELFR